MDSAGIPVMFGPVCPFGKYRFEMSHWMKIVYTLRDKKSTVGLLCQNENYNYKNYGNSHVSKRGVCII